MRGAKHSQLVLAPRNEIQLRVVGFSLDHADINLKVEHSGDDLGRIGSRELHFGVWILVQIAGEIAGCQMIANGEARADLQVTQLFMPGQS